MGDAPSENNTESEDEEESIKGRMLLLSYKKEDRPQNAMDLLKTKYLNTGKSSYYLVKAVPTIIIISLLVSLFYILIFISSILIRRKGKICGERISKAILKLGSTSRATMTKFV